MALKCLSITTDAMVERMVRDCLACQVVTPKISRMPLKMTPLPGETMEKVSADFYGPLPTGEYLLLATCKYSRYPFIEIVTSTAAKVVIPHFERIFSEFGYPSEVTADNGPDHHFVPKNSKSMLQSLGLQYEILRLANRKQMDKRNGL